VVADSGKNPAQIADRLTAGQIVIAPGSNAGKQQISYSCIQP